MVIVAEAGAVLRLIWVGAVRLLMRGEKNAYRHLQLVVLEKP